MFIALYTYPAENKYLALPRFACHMLSQCFLRLPSRTFDVFMRQILRRIDFA